MAQNPALPQGINPHRMLEPEMLEVCSKTWDITTHTKSALERRFDLLQAEVLHRRCVGASVLQQSGQHPLGVNWGPSRRDFKEQVSQQMRLYRHIRAQWEDRRTYWGLRDKARSPHPDLATVIIDSMDRSKYGMPQWPGGRGPKDAEKLQGAQLAL